MPKWGLTPEQREAQPWGLPSAELAPAKTITDPVHGDIFVTRLEQRVIDSAPMQRLRRVRQLGATHLVYPGATHTRFSHCLGALRSAQDLFDAVVDHRHGPHAVRDLFGEWESNPAEYRKRVAEATVLARLGALLHDLTHVPFGHSVEDDIGLLTPHDENVPRFEELWSQF
jgi:HD superfamily phosphohydrolase